MMDYKKIKNEFDKVPANWREKLKATLFSYGDLKSGEVLKNNLIVSGEVLKNAKVENVIIYHRNKLIDIKLDHTMRIVNDITKMAESMDFQIDFVKLLKVSALFHDIARFPQAATNNNFVDKSTLLFNGKSHAEYGYDMMQEEKYKSRFEIPENVYDAVGYAVRYHQQAELNGFMSIKVTNPSNLNLDVLRGKYTLNSSEQLIIATIVQMVKDVDQIDILYQNLTGEFPVIRSSVVYGVLNDTLDDISKHFGISKEEIMKFNNMKTEEIISSSINVPVENVDANKLEVPEDFKKNFLKTKKLNLKTF